jgi:hypothetical protein
MPISVRRGLIDELHTQLAPMSSQTNGFGNFTKGHQELAQGMLKNPDGIWALNPDAIDAQLDGLSKSAHESLKAMLKATGGNGHEVMPGEAPAQKKEMGPDGKWAQPTAKPAGGKTIRAQKIDANGNLVGKPGSMLEEDFDPKKYKRL